MRMPPAANLPAFGWLPVTAKNKHVDIPYIKRDGTGGPALFFVHGLGGCKENFYAAMQSKALADCTLVSFDHPGTGLARYDPQVIKGVSDLADISQAIADVLVPGPYFLVGASMGGLIALLQLRRHGTKRIQGFINIEGNLAPEDCMFSRRVVEHDLETFGETVFEKMIEGLRGSLYAGDRLIAQNMELNLDVRAYHAYSFETVEESDSGKLLEEFLALKMPRMFLYGEANKHLSYLPKLYTSEVHVREVPRSAHFLFYDNPFVTYNLIGEFVHA